jgi:enediyne biosynthesis protein E4
MVIGWRYRWFVLAIVVLGMTIVAGSLWWRSHQLRQAIREIEIEMAAGRHAIAARRLNELLIRAPGYDKAAYLLGVCEQTRGHTEPAEKAWARVTPGSSFFSRAVSDHLSLLVGTGRYELAEQMINEAANDPRVDGPSLRILLVPLFTQQGRLEDAQRLIEERWEHLHEKGEEASELAVNLARLSLDLQWTPPTIEPLRAELARVAPLAPDDARVWLAQATLAVRTGLLAEAKRLLTNCLERSPDDPSVWRARLRCAMAADRSEVVRQALSHLSAGELTPPQTDRVHAWLAASEGDRAAEQQALDRVIAADPGDLSAWKRLADLARQDGQPERAAEIERRSVEIARLNERFRKLYDRNQPIRDSVEMGQVAGNLGHTFVAKVFLTVAAAKSLHPDHARHLLERLSQQPVGSAEALTPGTALISMPF